MDKLEHIREMLEAAGGANENNLGTEDRASSVVINGPVYAGPITVTFNSASDSDLKQQTARIVGRIEGILSAEGKAFEAAFLAVLKQKYGVAGVPDLSFEQIREVIGSFNQVVRRARLLSSV